MAAVGGIKVKVTAEAVRPRPPGRHTFRITNGTGLGRDTYVVIDGEDVSPDLQAVTVRASANGLVEIELEPLVTEAPAFGGRPARVVFGGATRDLLIRHGWTPPADDEG